MKGAGRQWLKTVVTGKKDEGVQRCEELMEQQEDKRQGTGSSGQTPCTQSQARL